MFLDRQRIRWNIIGVSSEGFVLGKDNDISRKCQHQHRLKHNAGSGLAYESSAGVGSDSQPRVTTESEHEFPDHYVLAVQYSLSICSVETCGQTTRGKLPTAFSIHGLWPKNKDGSDAPSTTKEEFNKNKFGSKLTEELRNYWFDAYVFDKPQLYSGFWKKEWDRHGMGSGLGLVDYFDTTAKIYQKFSGEFKAIAQKNKYIPGTLFDLSQFANSFSPSLAVPWIRCDELKNGTVLVTEMQFKVEPSGTGEFKPHPYSKTDQRCRRGSGLAMLPSTEPIPP